LSERVDPVFRKLVKDVLREKPFDILPYLTNWFNREHRNENDNQFFTQPKKYHSFLNCLEKGPSTAEKMNLQNMDFIRRSH